MPTIISPKPIQIEASAWVEYPILTPSLIVDLDKFENNLKEMFDIAQTAGVELLPHAKTHRIIEAGLCQIKLGADGLCVAKLGEAEAFVEGGIARIFVANPIVGKENTQRALRLHQKADLQFATDSVDAAMYIGKVFEESKLSAKMLLAIDSGLGREGSSPEKAVALAVEINKLPGIDLVGIYTHEGTVYGAKSPSELIDRSRKVAEMMVALANSIRDQGVKLPIVSLGASASARTVAHVPGVTQIRPGIYAFNDVGQIALGNATLESTAIRVIATVISHPDPDRACIDAGSKAMSTDLVPAYSYRNEYPGHGMIVNAPGWVIEKMSEEHGWLRWHGEDHPSALPVGSRLEIIPNHACMAFAMLRRARIVKSGQIVDTWESFGPGSSE